MGEAVIFLKKCWTSVKAFNPIQKEQASLSPAILFNVPAIKLDMNIYIKTNPASKSWPWAVGLLYLLHYLILVVFRSVLWVCCSVWPFTACAGLQAAVWSIIHGCKLCKASGHIHHFQGSRNAHSFCHALAVGAWMSLPPWSSCYPAAQGIFSTQCSRSAAAWQSTKLARGHKRKHNPV